jgi:hypothetical protein
MRALCIMPEKQKWRELIVPLGALPLRFRSDQLIVDCARGFLSHFLKRGICYGFRPTAIFSLINMGNWRFQVDFLSRADI